jgi:serine phosphatase RsbU (regulator of sigma subunit)
VDNATQILVVDDEAVNVRLLESILEPYGATVVHASNGRECLELLDEYMPDVVLLDVMMPGMDGFEVTRRMRTREHTRLTPVILITSLGDIEDRITGLRAGCDDFISKPFDRRELLARIEACLSRREDWLRCNQAERAEHDRIRQELKRARLTQKMLLPASFPAIDGLEIWGVNVSSEEVSGDYFDVIELGPDGPVVLAIADVSGKGLPAALVMSNIQAGLRSSLSHGVLDPARILSQLNQLVCANTAIEIFVTMFVAVYSKNPRRLVGARAGHEFPIVVRQDGLQTLTTGGPVLGCVPDAPFETFSIDLARGDVLVLYTDGVTDAADASDTSFGMQRIADAVISRRGKSAENLGKSILQDVTVFTDGAGNTDDMTVLVLRVTEPELANID